ncbi:hypothetical protein [Priestia megaterium]|uniref:hypothetical protein n=1 Tax=Priestia megaterium TaxID=1404 RepID=UPI001DDA3B1E|nr:hypothetical protein [Priestia megaterium]CAH0305385.1 hypothetical protein SRABI82_04708 [Priestia megaterium]
MASNKTPNLGMDVWAETDYFKRAELNGNFGKLDDKIGSLQKDVETDRINVLYPPTPLVACKGDANYYNVTNHKWYKDAGYTAEATDDAPALKAIIDYAIANKRNIKLPIKTYKMSSPLIFPDNIHLDIEGGDKEDCRLAFSCDTGIWFKRGVVRMSNLQIMADLPIQSSFKALQLGDVVVTDANDSLHWGGFSNLKITGCNQGIGIGNYFDSSLSDIDIVYLSGSNATGVNFLPLTGSGGVCSNNLLFNRIRIESFDAGAIALNFNAGSTAPTANFVFNSCHFEAHRLDSNLVSINSASNITFISGQFSHSGASGETVENNRKQTFIFNNAFGVKFIACGVGGTFSTNIPTDTAPKLIKLMGESRFISFDNCMISPPYQGGNYQNRNLFNVDASFTTGEYPEFINCMIGNNKNTLDRFSLGFNSMSNYNNKQYIGMGSDYGLHVTSSKWDLKSTPDDINNYSPFSTFMQNGIFKTGGIMGRHSGSITANGGTKVIAYNGRTGVTQSGLYIINVSYKSNGNAYTALINYNNYQSAVTSIYMGTLFSTTKDTASKVNVYHLNGQLNIQNMLPSDDVNYSIVPFFIS